MRRKNRKIPGCRHVETPGHQAGGQDALAATF
jgi:hypothetical protein